MRTLLNVHFFREINFGFLNCHGNRFYCFMWRLGFHLFVNGATNSDRIQLCQLKPGRLTRDGSTPTHVNGGTCIITPSSFHLKTRKFQGVAP